MSRGRKVEPGWRAPLLFALASIGMASAVSYWPREHDPSSIVDRTALPTFIVIVAAEAAWFTLVLWLARLSWIIGSRITVISVLAGLALFPVAWLLPGDRLTLLWFMLVAPLVVVGSLERSQVETAV